MKKLIMSIFLVSALSFMASAQTTKPKPAHTQKTKTVAKTSKTTSATAKPATTTAAKPATATTKTTVAVKPRHKKYMHKAKPKTSK